MRSGCQRSWRKGNSNRDDMTPTTVTDWPLTWIERPRMPGSALNSSVQTRWLITATGGEDSKPSSGKKPRPSEGRTPITSNRLVVA